MGELREVLPPRVEVQKQRVICTRVALREHHGLVHPSECIHVNRASVISKCCTRYSVIDYMAQGFVYELVTGNGANMKKGIWYEICRIGSKTDFKRKGLQSGRKSEIRNFFTIQIEKS